VWSADITYVPMQHGFMSEHSQISGRSNGEM
jgi:hypothetical protein